MANDRPQRKLLVLLLLLLLLLHQTPGHAGQVLYSFRFHPVVGTRVHTISRSDISMRSVFRQGGTLDSVTVASERLESLTNWIEAASGGRFSAVLVYDSITVRTNSPGGRWLDVNPTEREEAVSRVVLTNRLEVLGAEFLYLPHLDASTAEVMRGVGAGVHVELPVNPVSVGEEWAVEFSYPMTFVSGFGNHEGVPTSGGLKTTAIARLDSVALRSSDTLAYITVVGQIVPSSEDGVFSMGGRIASTLVWSSGWRAYASAATKAVIVVQRLRGGEDTENVLRMRFDITTQTRVRT